MARVSLYSMTFSARPGQRNLRVLGITSHPSSALPTRQIQFSRRSTRQLAGPGPGDPRFYRAQRQLTQFLVPGGSVDNRQIQYILGTC